MNRGILIVICDFLIISLLALASFDKPEEEDPREKEKAIVEEAAQEDLIEVLKLSLETEEEERERLHEELLERTETLDRTAEELEKTKSSLGQTELSLESIQKNLEAERENLAETRKKLEMTKEEARRLAEEKKISEIEQRERQRLLQQQLQSRERRLAKAEDNIKQLEETKSALERETQIMATTLKIRETEKEMLAQNLIAAEAEIETERLEKTIIQKHASQLADGVTQLADTSTATLKEIRQMKPALSSNTIFLAYQNNRAGIGFSAVEEGMFGVRQKQYATRTLFVTDGGNIYAVFNSAGTPFDPSGNGARLTAVEGKLAGGGHEKPIESVSFLLTHPGLIAVPVPKSFAEKTELRVFALAPDPFRFPEAVLIGGGEGYYGESKFKIDPARKHTLLMEKKLFSKLFGEFSPSRNDLVFAKTGDFIGWMQDGEHCLLIDNFQTAGTIAIGEDFQPGHAAAVIEKIREMMN